MEDGGDLPEWMKDFDRLGLSLLGRPGNSARQRSEGAFTNLSSMQGLLHLKF
jgi:hypothetical protein